jgi:hypothetical protein
MIVHPSIPFLAFTACLSGGKLLFRCQQRWSSPPGREEAFLCPMSKAFLRLD